MKQEEVCQYRPAPLRGLPATTDECTLPDDPQELEIIAGVGSAARHGQILPERRRYVSSTRGR